MAFPAGRGSYSALMRQPAWLLCKGEKLVASCRAVDADAARRVFKRAGLDGTHMRRSPS